MNFSFQGQISASENASGWTIKKQKATALVGGGTLDLGLQKP
jgi:hypothetical protein